MSKDYKVDTFGKGEFIMVMNYKSLNEVTNYHFNNKSYIKKQDHAIGYWKPKIK